MCQLWMWVKARREFMVTEKFPSPVFFRTECFFLGGNGCGGRAGTFGPRDRRLLLALFDSGARGAPPSFPGRRRRRERCERGRERKRHSARLRKMNDIRVCGGSRVDLSNTFVWVCGSVLLVGPPCFLPACFHLRANCMRETARIQTTLSEHFLGSAKSRLLIICAEKTAGAIVLDFPSCFLRVAGRRVPIGDLELCALVGIRKLYETRSVFYVLVYHADYFFS